MGDDPDDEGAEWRRQAAANQSAGKPAHSKSASFGTPR